MKLPGILLVGILFALAPASLNAQNFSPCGPDSIKGPLRKLIPQGAGGADFRPACVEHDACYDSPCANKDACDQRFLQAMLASCECASRPHICRRRARQMYRLTAHFGAGAFRKAQAGGH